MPQNSYAYIRLPYLNKYICNNTKVHLRSQICTVNVIFYKGLEKYILFRISNYENTIASANMYCYVAFLTKKQRAQNVHFISNFELMKILLRPIICTAM